MTPRMATLLGGLMLLVLGLDTLPLGIPIQVAPATSLIALLALPLALSRVRVTPLFWTVLAFFVYAVAHSAIAVVVDMGFVGQPPNRAASWARQLVALTAGVAVFVVLRTALRDMSERRVRWFVIAGSVPAVGLALLNLMWGITGNGLAGAVVRGVRQFIAPLGYTSRFRASGLSLEPAVFALFLALVVIPFLLLALRGSRRRVMILGYIGLTLLAFAWTFSATGAGVLFLLCAAGLLVGPERPAFGSAVGAATLGVVLLVVAFPGNYAVAQVSSVFRGNLDLSATTKFFSTLGPVYRMDTSLASLGYGLGGSPFHLRDLVSEATYNDIMAVSWAGTPNLKTLWGRLVGETGLFGVALILGIVAVAWRQVRAIRFTLAPQEVRLARMAMPAMLAYFVGATVTSGLSSLALPTMWFWLAVIDSRYLQLLEAPNAPQTVRRNS